jgi:hypothetical protein
VQVDVLCCRTDGAGLTHGAPSSSAQALLCLQRFAPGKLASIQSYCVAAAAVAALHTSIRLHKAISHYVNA